MTNIEKALLIAESAHKGQVDKGGNPYLIHPLYVAFQMKTEEEIIVALLHDVIEDSKYTLNDLKEEGFSEEICINIKSHISITD